jgi:hypothetical protein
MLIHNPRKYKVKRPFFRVNSEFFGKILSEKT